MNLPETKAELALAINTIIAVYEYNIGKIDENKSLHFEIEETEKTFKVTFKFITAIIPIEEPERDETEWGDDFFVILKTEPMSKLVAYINDICEMVSSLTIRSEREEYND